MAEAGPRGAEAGRRGRGVWNNNQRIKKCVTQYNQNKSINNEAPIDNIKGNKIMVGRVA